MFLTKKSFKKRTTAKFGQKNPKRDFFLNQAIEWHDKGFTCREMAEEMIKYGYFPEDVVLRNAMSNVASYARNYCVEQPKKSVLEPSTPKRYKIKVEYI